LVGFCREGQFLWPWENEIVGALAAGWPCDPDLKRGALARIHGIGYPGSWASKPAIDYLLQGCPGDDDVARMVADQLALLDRSHRELSISDAHEALLRGFAKHPLVVPARSVAGEKRWDASFAARSGRHRQTRRHAKVSPSTPRMVATRQSHAGMDYFDASGDDHT